MNITTKGRYALRIMIDIAQHNNHGYISLREVAERQQVSLKYMENIISDLKNAGLIDSSRGKDGGYRLNRHPNEYSISEILKAADETLSSIACISTGTVQCSRASECITLPMWQELDKITNSYLKGISLEDLISGERWKDNLAKRKEET